jgi:hypothetical protein
MLIFQYLFNGYNVNNMEYIRYLLALQWSYINKFRYYRFIFNQQNYYMFGYKSKSYIL